VLRAWRCKVQNASFSTPSTSTTTSQLQRPDESFLGGEHLVLTGLIAHTTALHCVWSPGAGHRSERLPQGVLPVSGMPWGSKIGSSVSAAASQARSTHFVQHRAATHVRRAAHAAQLILGLGLETESRPGQNQNSRQRL
jgi:hypothetical protein